KFAQAHDSGRVPYDFPIRQGRFAVQLSSQRKAGARLGKVPAETGCVALAIAPRFYGCCRLGQAFVERRAAQGAGMPKPVQPSSDEVADVNDVQQRGVEATQGTATPADVAVLEDG